ncbi:MAG TPA: hypothetical protein VGD04_10925 [Methylophilus sp.]
MDLILDPFSDLSINDINSPYEYKLKIKTFANNTIDMVMTKIKHRIPKLHNDAFHGTMTLHSKTLTDDEREAKDAENSERAIRRAKQSVHHAARQINADHMLTLTTRENITDRTEFLSLFTRFIRLVREKNLIDGVLHQRTERREYHYVGVPEMQDRGAYHMHIACHGKQDLNLLRACWYVALGGTPHDSGSNTKGQVDVRYHKRRFSGLTEQHQTALIVQYLTKYISKSFEENRVLGTRRYARSLGIPPVNEQKQPIQSTTLNGGNFFTAMQEVISVADFLGVKGDYQLWNRLDDVFVLRGNLCL